MPFTTTKKGSTNTAHLEMMEQEMSDSLARFINSPSYNTEWGLIKLMDAYMAMRDAR